jgi:hypothetical protein
MWYSHPPGRRPRSGARAGSRRSAIDTRSEWSPDSASVASPECLPAASHERRASRRGGRLARALAMHQRTAVLPSATGVGRANPRRQDTIRLHALRQQQRTPLLESGPRHLEHSTHRDDVKDARVRVDEHESRRASLAKKAVVFLRMLRSSATADSRAAAGGPHPRERHRGWEIAARRSRLPTPIP